MLFDLDGVLVDSRVPIARCMNHALACEGLAPEPEAALHRWIGPPLRDAFRALLAARGADPARAAACIGHYRERYASLSLEATTLQPGVAGLLERLGDRLPLGVATSKPEAFARPILESLGVAAHFRAVVGPSLHESHREDKAATVGRALAALGAPAGAGAGAMVGDRAVDVAAGRAHGLAALAVAWGIGERDELLAAGPDALLESPAELLAWLEAAAAAAPGPA